MPLEIRLGTSLDSEWRRSQDDLARARQELARAPAGVVRQTVYDRLLQAQRRGTAVVHTWLAQALPIERVVEPHSLLSLDIDGVLEEEIDDVPATGLPGAAALRLMQLGGVAVVLNSGRSFLAVKDRVEQFCLLGGIASFGAAVWDDVYRRKYSLLSDRGQEQLARLRQQLRTEPEFVLDPSHVDSVRVSRVADGRTRTIAAPEARAILDQNGLTDLSYWVAPTHTDFIERRSDKATGLAQLRQALGLAGMDLAAIGDSACDISTLRQATSAFLPAATLPSLTPRGRQRLVRSRYLGQDALWDAAYRLVPSGRLRRQVREEVERITFPDWFPGGLRRRPSSRPNQRFAILRPDRFAIKRRNPTDYERRP
jgi:hydroxymethylpyrimidine pyrophosphatase-like HAD family hydrolase